MSIIPLSSDAQAQSGAILGGEKKDMNWSQHRQEKRARRQNGDDDSMEEWASIRATEDIILDTTDEHAQSAMSSKETDSKVP